MSCADGHCITCGDVAVPLRVVAVDGDLARCARPSGGEETVDVSLVAGVEPGDEVLVHAGVAIA